MYTYWSSDYNHFYFIGIEYYSSYYKGCNIETDVARSYGIECYLIGDIGTIMPDAVELENKYVEEQI